MRPDERLPPNCGHAGAILARSFDEPFSGLEEQQVVHAAEN